MTSPLEKLNIVMVPGLNNSTEDHWQSIWQNKLPNTLRVEQKKWSQPNCKEWVNTLSETISKINGKVVLVAHSLGCITVAHLDGFVTDKISGAFLVAPADPEKSSAFHTFTPVPFKKFPYPSLLVASTNDPYCPSRLASAFARSWGSNLLKLNDAGHVNVKSGHGHWPLGWALLNGFCEEILAS